LSSLQSGREHIFKSEMPSSPRSPVRRAAAHSGDFSPAGPASSTAFNEGGGEGSASKNGRRNLLSSAAAPASATTESVPALFSRGLLGFVLGCLGVLTFMWLSSMATTADGVPSTLLLARQRSDREVRIRNYLFSPPPRSLALAGHSPFSLHLPPSPPHTQKKTRPPALPRPRPRGNLLRGLGLGRRLLRPLPVDPVGQGLVRP